MPFTVDPLDNRSLDRNTIISQAYHLAGVVPTDEVPAANLIDSGSILLNAIIEQKRGKMLFLRDKDYIPFSVRDSDIVTNNGLFFEVIRTHESTDDKEPGVGDVYKLFWKEIPDPGTGPPAWEQTSPVVTVYEFIGNPRVSDLIVDVELIRVRTNPEIAGTSQIVSKFNDEEFLDIYDPLQSPGTPFQFYFQKKKLFNSIYLQPAPLSSTYLFYIRGYRTPEGLEDPNDVSSLDTAFLPCLMFSLGVMLAISYGRDPDHVKQMRTLESQLWRDARSADTQTGDLQLTFPFTSGEVGGF